jgi:hypothetical protein
MQNHLIDSSAASRSGIGPNKRIFKVPSGEYVGRMVILLQTSPMEIKLSFSDPPYASWSTPVLMVSDSADFPFDAAMADSGNIYLVYTLGTGSDLVIRELTFNGGGWTIGSLSTIYDGDDNYYPSINIEPPDRLWVSWSRLVSGDYYVNVKFSDDWGVNWPNGLSSAGTTLSGAGEAAYSKVLIRESHVYIVYVLGSIKLAFRKKHFSAALWESEENIAMGSGYDQNFDAAVSQDGKIGVVFDDGKIKFREFNGNIWGALAEINSNGGSFPQIRYINNCPYLIYLSTFGVGQNRILYTRRLTESFSVPAVLDSRKSSLSKVICYHATSGSYKDLTSAAASDTAGDIFHSDSGVIFIDAGDAFYLGAEEKFNYLKIFLSTAGVGGTVVWQYFNGQEWINFVPFGGSYDFTTAGKELLLWDDYDGLPSDWQRKIVNAADKFWIRVLVVSPFGSGPIGTQITSITNVGAVVLLE